MEFIRQDSLQTQFLMTRHFIFILSHCWKDIRQKFVTHWEKVLLSIIFILSHCRQDLKKKFVTQWEKVLLEPSVRSHAKSIFI